ncbi:hypothetical protein FB451DRAFT_1208853 [Mycena latifolia]|nr:hypothetical protein FB451DRAFT_1223674 [Mycena latifolia]KAJ7496806.1 hypothetical protein FB451DRAFT_1208853 [Mycena latifolia]
MRLSKGIERTSSTLSLLVTLPMVLPAAHLMTQNARFPDRERGDEDRGASRCGGGTAEERGVGTRVGGGGRSGRCG